MYDRRSAEALIPSVGVNENGNGEVFRLNLDLGRYMRAYEVEVGGDDMTSAGGGALQGGIATGSVNTAAIAEESHGLLAFGTSIGSVEFWDPRARNRVGILHSPTASDFVEGKQEITTIEFDGSGLGLATGSSTGLIHVYDLRSPIPLLKKDQGYGYPIHTLIYLSSPGSSRAQTDEPKILSADKRIIKIWDQRNGTPWTSVEPAVNINSVAWCKESGLILTANEGKQQHSFFVPQLGPAPKWCSFLDSLVEEMAEDPNDPNVFTSQKSGEVYDNYKFLTTQQLETLNLSHLIGTTSLLRPYMHGFFVDQRLYEEAKLIADPFIYEEQRAKRVKEKIDRERESRIRGTKKVTAKVNKRLAEKLLEREEKNQRRKAKRVLEKGGDDDMVDIPAVQDQDEPERPAQPRNNPLTDPRFAKLFEDEDYAIDETSREFQSLNPSTIPNGDPKTSRKLTAAEEEELEALNGADASSSNDSSTDEDSAPPQKPTPEDTQRISSISYKRTKSKPRQPQMRISSSSRKPSAVRERSFASRAAQMRKGGSEVKKSSGTVVGERQITFAPERKSKTGALEMQEKRGREGGGKRDKDRRTASGNFFRGL